MIMRYFRDYQWQGKKALTDKKYALNMHINYMLCRTQSMFEYEGMPSTIPADIFELYLQTKGNCFVTMVDGCLYALTGNLGGLYDEYNRLSEYTVVNHALKLNKTYKVDVDGILVKNDCLELGLLPLFHKYCTLMVENEISMLNASINSRMVTIISAGDERTKQSAELYLNKIEKGDNGIIGENPFFEGLRSQPISVNANKTISELIALQQYIKAAMFNEIGLDANYNMKKERITNAEAQLSDDFLLPFIDDMMKCRQNAIQRINRKYGTNIGVKFASTWLTNEMENEKQKEIYETDSDNIDAQKEFDDNIIRMKNALNVDNLSTDATLNSK